ncbi:MAG: sigma-70 family RNA polymerase sigma factor [Phycisphaerales bacterium]|nr:sigma-70 family RNA polymerase sigma factor [Phycisphaerales bacterium]
MNDLRLGAMNGTADDGAVDTAAAIAGDPDALHRLWARHRRWVAAILLAHKPSFVELDDLLQEVAMVMVRRVHELRDPASLRGWLRVVAVNAARAAARSAKCRLSPERLHGQAEPPDGVRIDPTALDDTSRIMAHIAELPEAYREPLVLRALQDLSYRQISETLDLPESTIQTRIARARRMLREAVERDDPTDRTTDRQVIPGGFR